MKESNIFKLAKNMLIGGTAGVIGVIVCQPLDFFKTRLQLANQTSIGKVEKIQYGKIFKQIIKT